MTVRGLSQINCPIFFSVQDYLAEQSSKKSNEPDDSDSDDSHDYMDMDLEDPTYQGSG